MRTIRRSDINAAVAEKTGIWRDDVDAVSRGMLTLLVSVLGSGETVKLTNFGSLDIRWRAERPGRNPRDGVPYPIAAHRTVVFIPSIRLLRKVDT